jgi:hypothetical protein
MLFWHFFSTSVEMLLTSSTTNSAQSNNSVLTWTKFVSINPPKQALEKTLKSDEQSCEFVFIHNLGYWIPLSPSLLAKGHTKEVKRIPTPQV